MYFCSCIVYFYYIRFSFFGTTQEMGWKERLRNNLFGVKTINSINEQGAVILEHVPTSFIDFTTSISAMNTYNYMQHTTLSQKNNTDIAHYNFHAINRC